MVAKAEPDVKLHWIIGRNYLGQTNDSFRKRGLLEARVAAGGGGTVLRPASSEVDDIVSTLTERMEAGGIVLVYQELFANPTTTLCDLIIPAAGWGEDSFCRYIAQRRLKLYERFQDMPLHQVDAATLGEKDPMQHLPELLHSPKPDWAIFADIARDLGRHVKDGDSVNASKVVEAFAWKDAAEVADEMAEKSHRKSILGALVPFAEAVGAGAVGRRVHSVLGEGGSGDAAHLSESAYQVGSDVIEADHSYRREAKTPSPTYGNEVASNGVILPLRFDGSRLLGTLRNVVGDHANGDKPLFYFVKAPWLDIEWAFRRANRLGEPPNDSIFLINGRFNHLWNNMLHHLRNDYVNERYPEDMPGTIVELNPTWAGARAIANGQVVEVSGLNGRFRAIASLQDGVAAGGGFAMFSYPATQGGALVFDAYANNVTDGYCDGINPIAALKYARMTVTKVPDPQTGAADWIFRSQTRSGPTYAQRNRIGPPAAMTPAGGRLSPGDRSDWEMRELIVRKGLPRAMLHQSNPLRKWVLMTPDAQLEELPTTRFRQMIELDIMKWQQGSAPPWDAWHGRDRDFALEWRGADGPANDTDPPDDDGNGDGELNGGGTATGFGRIKEILDGSIDASRKSEGRDPNLGFLGPSFGWSSRTELLAASAFTRRLIPPEEIGNNNGNQTNLAVASRSGVATFTRMPSADPFLSEEEIQEIAAWIDAGCPD